MLYQDTFKQHAALWGRLYEIMAKRGTLACLIDRGLKGLRDADGKVIQSLNPWKGKKLSDVSKTLLGILSLNDSEARDVIKENISHLACVAFGNSYTITRAYLARVENQVKSLSKVEVKSLWCPLVMPLDNSREYVTDKHELLEAFTEEFHLLGQLDISIGDKGYPANSDFTLWLSTSGEARSDYLLVQEYSYNMPPQLLDFRTQAAHLTELKHYLRVVESRSVFAHIAAEVHRGDRFKLSDDIYNYISSLKTSDKPLYKLCQACSYAKLTVQLLRLKGILNKSCVATAMSITPHGVESLSTHYPNNSTSATYEENPDIALMSKMADVYQKQPRSLAQSSDSANVRTASRNLLTGLASKMPKSFRKEIMDKLQVRNGDTEWPSKDITFPSIYETIADTDNTNDTDSNIVGYYTSPNKNFGITEAKNKVADTEPLNAYFGGSAKEAIGKVMDELAINNKISLRNIHAAAVVAGLRHARKGFVNVLALEGNPGIGKTTAVCRYLQENVNGYLFLYLSPRIAINTDVINKLARDKDNNEPTGILTITTNSKFITNMMDSDSKNEKKESCAIYGAVEVDGVKELKKPEKTSIKIVDKADASYKQNGETDIGRSRFTAHQISEHEDIIADKKHKGVLACMAISARELLQLNPDVNRVVLAAAIQGFRKLLDSNTTTIDSMNNIFTNSRNPKTCLEERQNFAKKIPTIIVMIDELAGDGAGAPLAHDVADWLYNEFIARFEENDIESPFTVVLIASDASLVNVDILNSYMDSGDATPNKILLSKPYSNDSSNEFAVSGNDAHIGKFPKAARRSLHVMTNSFPAKKLNMHYKIRTVIKDKKDIVEHYNRKKGNKSKNIDAQAQGKIVYDFVMESKMQKATETIYEALDSGAKQVIYYAQNKPLINQLKNRLIGSNSDLTEEKIGILHSNSTRQQRDELLDPKNRDSKRLLLMTSSGARGISFPLADWIIVDVPNFTVETALMEINQVIYRSRGIYSFKGKDIPSDNDEKHVVLCIDDCIIVDDMSDDRQLIQLAMHHVNILTLVIMLRSAMMTRIKGESGLGIQKIALVPVGSIRLEDNMSSSMTDAINDFYREASLYAISDESERSQQAVCFDIIKLLESMFASFKLEGIFKRDMVGDKRTFVISDNLWNYMSLVASEGSPLLLTPSDKKNSNTKNSDINLPVLPDMVSFCGPAIVEQWSDKMMMKRENFSFKEYLEKHKDTKSQFISHLKAIRNSREQNGSNYNYTFPKDLRSAAEDVLKMIDNHKSDSGRASEVNVMKNTTKNVWVAMPAGYCQLMPELNKNRTDDKTHTETELYDQNTWRNVLGRVLDPYAKLMPVISKYTLGSMPWAAVIGSVDPLRLNLVFDDKYFMISNEINMLNAMLFDYDEQS